MEKARKMGKKTLVTKASLVRKAWLNITLFLLAGATIGSGVYLGSQAQLSKRADISWYNQGVSAYSLPAELLPATDDRPSEYPIIRAVAYFQQAALESTDDGIKALALYNLGTLMGEDSLNVLSEGTPLFGVLQAISNLEEVVRIDPNNENAKYNLELLEELKDVLIQKPMSEQMPMASLEQKAGHSLGEEIDRGF